ncbi:MAG TPA: hypothetical protein PKE57_08945 [Cellvibrionaceae bacterium]|nr:hypothetical protein [Cellvibrionaceae bacterium]HMW49817.1 hypothetical protein [Cellvibrionaceae bacterium]HMW73828.1 hypothetical protein [Cellvibrionaceae bacterium]HMY40705.1 hypothetical protein [Marinagarivorans sp.]HNG60721.1 hypothetical protein [Cellvibrionaceae bacterium]
MRLSADHLQAQGFTYYRAPQVAAAGRTFDAVATPGSAYEVRDSTSAPGAKASYSPPLTAPIRSGAGVFQAVAEFAPARPVIDIYV